MTSLIRRNPAIFPTSLFNDVFKDVDHLFGEHKLGVPYNLEQLTDKDGNIIANRIEVALAGKSKDEIAVKVTGDELSIFAEKTKKVTEEDDVDDDKNYYYHGIAERSVSLKFKLPASVDKPNIKSTYKDGMLTIDIPLAEKEVIDIKVD